MVTSDKNIDEEWTYYLLAYLRLNQYATGQAQPGLSVQALEKVAVAYPVKKREQQKIAGCLSGVDSFIIAQSKKIENLETHKKGLMQGLFPSLEEEDA